jgi:hypothetical protein
MFLGTNFTNKNTNKIKTGKYLCKEIFPLQMTKTLSFEGTSFDRTSLKNCELCFGIDDELKRTALKIPLSCFFS